MMDIDTEKLNKIIQASIHDIGGCCITSESCIGVIDGMQIIITVTKDDDEMFDEPMPELFCINTP